MPTAPDPTTAEWVAASVAAGLVVLLAAVHLLRPVLRRSPATRWGRAAGLLLGALATGLVLCAAVAVAAGYEAGKAPAGPFAAALVHPDADYARNIARYAAALLVPGAAVLGVLALAVVAVGRPSGLRAAAGLACGTVLGGAWLVVQGDTGTVVTGTALSALALAGAAAAALLVDELLGRRPASPGA